MIETKESLIGNINASQSLVGSLNKATEYITPLTQEKTATPSTNVQEIKPDENYTGLSKVTVEAVTNEIDDNIQPSNIKLGVSILGIEGVLEEGYQISIEDNTLIFSNGVVEEGELII